MRRIEVFVENNCPACDVALASAISAAKECSTNLRVFQREIDRDIFRQRGIAVCPATFVDGKLSFYGEFSFAEIRDRLHRTS